MEGREEGKGREGGRGEREEGRKGRGVREGRGDCYTYSNIIQLYHRIYILYITYYVIT